MIAHLMCVLSNQGKPNASDPPVSCSISPKGKISPRVPPAQDFPSFTHWGSSKMLVPWWLPQPLYHETLYPSTRSGAFVKSSNLPALQKKSKFDLTGKRRRREVETSSMQNIFTVAMQKHLGCQSTRSRLCACAIRNRRSEFPRPCPTQSPSHCKSPPFAVGSTQPENPDSESLRDSLTSATVALYATARPPQMITVANNPELWACKAPQ